MVRRGEREVTKREHSRTSKLLSHLGSKFFKVGVATERILTVLLPLEGLNHISTEKSPPFVRFL